MEDRVIDDDVLRLVKKKRIWQRASRIAEALGLRNEWGHQFTVTTLDVEAIVGRLNLKIHKSTYGGNIVYIKVKVNGADVFCAADVSAYGKLLNGEISRIFMLSKKEGQKVRVDRYVSGKWERALVYGKIAKALGRRSGMVDMPQFFDDS